MDHVTIRKSCKFYNMVPWGKVQPAFKAWCLKPPGHYLCAPEPGRPDCVISIHIGVNGDAYPVAVSQKVTKNLPVSFYSPTSGFNVCFMKYTLYVCFILVVLCFIQSCHVWHKDYKQGKHISLVWPQPGPELPTFDTKPHACQPFAT